MPDSPFIDDPRDVVRRHIALAVASPIEEVRAIHIRAAEHHAQIAKAAVFRLTLWPSCHRVARVTERASATSYSTKEKTNRARQQRLPM